MIGDCIFLHRQIKGHELEDHHMVRGHLDAFGCGAYDRIGYHCLMYAW